MKFGFLLLVGAVVTCSFIDQSSAFRVTTKPIAAQVALKPQSSLNQRTQAALNTQRPTRRSISMSVDISKSTPDVGAAFSYVSATGIQWSLILGYLNIMEKALTKLALPTILQNAVMLAFFFFMSIRSRVFSPLDNSRPSASKDDPVFKDRKRPSWQPPPKAFPLIWTTIAFLRTFSSFMIYRTSGLVSKPIMAMMAHLSIGDTWNTINNVERRMGTAALGVQIVMASVYYAVFQYYKANKLAGKILAPSAVWLTIANFLVVTIWRINTPLRPLFPSKEEGPPSKWRMPLNAAELISTSTSSSTSKANSGAQDFLEADPYYSTANIPLQTFKAKEPFIGKIVSTKRIVGAQATGETCNIVINHEGKMPYWEGQSYGVIPPGTNPKNGKQYTNRLYSIASSRYGDDMSGTTTTLCVRRATYWCPEMQAEDPAKKGVCSNFLCDTRPGDEVMLTGPTGKVMLMPEDKPEADLIMVATGTGIAPYRAFWKRLFIENTPAAKAFKGVAWLFLGVANSDALLYDDELQMIKDKFPHQFKLDYALSREQTNKKGGKMYIQDKVEEYSEEIFERMDKGAHMYFCGLKGMMPGILEMLEGVAASKGLVWKDKLAEWKGNGQWHVEVY